MAKSRGIPVNGVKDEEPVVHRGKNPYQKPKYKQWFKKFSSDRTAGAYNFLQGLRKNKLLWQVEDILRYVETLEDTNTIILAENSLLRHELKSLKEDLYSVEDARNMEISQRLNANKNEVYHRKKNEQLKKALFRASKINKKLYFMLDNINKQISFLKTLNFYKDTY